MPCALVLSAGGMFGAYQAGAWKTLAGHFQPDMVVGASVGALNGWAIAGGCSPAELIATWTDPDLAGLMRPRFTALPWRGVFDPAPLARHVDDLFARFRPHIPYSATLVEVPRLRPVLVRGEQMTPAHLRASCAIPLGYPPVRIDGKFFVDGGLLAVVPLFAAVEMGATCAVVVNSLPMMPSRLLRATVGAFRAMAAPRAYYPGLEVIEIRATPPLGSVRDALHWKEENVRRWIAQGERDAAAALRSLTNCSHPVR
jgi:NTE family protein